MNNNNITSTNTNIGAFHFNPAEGTLQQRILPERLPMQDNDDDEEVFLNEGGEKKTAPYLVNKNSTVAKGVSNGPPVAELVRDIEKKKKRNKNNSDDTITETSAVADSMIQTAILQKSKNPYLLGIIIVIVLIIIVASVSIPIVLNNNKKESSNNNNDDENTMITTTAVPSLFPTVASLFPSSVPSIPPSVKPPSASDLPAWIKLGQDIDGIDMNDYSGESISLSSSGYRVAVGAQFWDNGRDFLNTGQVQVWDYDTDEEKWIHAGPPVLGNMAPKQYFGDAVALSGDGRILAVWSSGGLPTVRVYVQTEEEEWKPIGQPLVNIGNGCHNNCLSMSYDGTILFIGSPDNQTASVFQIGQEVVEQKHSNEEQYEQNNNTATTTSNTTNTTATVTTDILTMVAMLMTDNVTNKTIHNVTINTTTLLEDNNVTNKTMSNNTNTTTTIDDTTVIKEWQWKPLGIPLVGTLTNDQFGISIDSTPDGKTFIVGAPGTESNAGGGEANFTGSPQIGYAEVYTYNDNDKNWIRRGDRIRSRDQTIGDQEGWDVAINADGTVVAVSSVLNDEGGENSGRVQIYRYNRMADDWFKVGSSIVGEAELDNSGWAISLSDDGNTVLVGGVGNRGRPPEDTDTAKSYNAGHTRAFRLTDGEDWKQLGNDMDGESYRDMSGYAVDCNTDCSIVAIGAIKNLGSGINNAGHVRVYRAPN